MSALKMGGRPIGWLVASSMIYLAAPHLLFFAGWLRQPWSLAASILLVAACATALADFGRNLGNAAAALAGDSLLTWRSLLAVLILGTAVVGVSGIGGYGFQDLDWTKHSLVLRDLINREWPVAYTHLGAPVALVYYVAYYLPAALGGKLGGWLAANDLLALWSLFGLAMAMLWFLVLVNRRPILAVLLLFVFFAGLDAVGVNLSHSPLGAFWSEEGFPARWGFGTNLDSWAGKWEYSGSLKLLFTVPNQALSGWLASALIVFTVAHTRSARSLLLVWSLTALWAPFVTIGLAPFLAADLMLRPGSLASRLRPYLSFANVTGLLLLALIGAFYASKLTPLIPLLDVHTRSGLLFAEIAGWAPRLRWLLMLTLFWCLEFGLFVAMIRWTGIPRQRELRYLLAVSVLWLLVLPFWVFGEINDLNMRASIPALFFIAVLTGQSILDGQTTRLQRGLWFVLLVLMAVNPALELASHLAPMASQHTLRHFKLAADDDRTLVTAFQRQPERLVQYVSSADAFFFTQFARAVHPAAAARQSQPVLFDGGLVLREGTLSAHQAEPGTAVVLDTTFQALEQPATNYSYATRLVGPQGQVVWEQQGWPAGQATDRWRPYHLAYDSRTLHIPPTTAPGVYLLEAYVTDPRVRDKVGASGLLTGDIIGLQAPLDYVIVGQPDDAAPYPVSAPVVFGGQIELLGSNLAPTTHATPGELLDVALTWRAVAAPERNLTATVQVLDSQGRLVAQQDRPPLGGLVPLTLWRPGFSVTDHYQVQLPDSLQPGRYDVIVGLYDAQGRRQPSEAGDSAPQDAYTLSRIEVAP